MVWQDGLNSVSRMVPPKAEAFSKTRPAMPATSKPYSTAEAPSSSRFRINMGGSLDGGTRRILVQVWAWTFGPRPHQVSSVCQQPVEAVDAPLATAWHV